jgi:glutamate-1-semialdehyde 2,1-aminomutase
MEAVVSNFGYAPAQIDFLQGMRDLTQELGMLLIFDEVQSFRIAPGGAQEALGVEPDLTALGKIIGGGLPAGAFGGRRDIMALFDPSRGEDAIPHAGTFNANPMTMVAGETTMRHLTPDVYERMNRLGGMLRAKLQAVFDEMDVPAQVTGIASFFGMHFTDAPVTDYRSTLAGNQNMTTALFTGLLNEGILLQQICAGSLVHADHRGARRRPRRRRAASRDKDSGLGRKGAAPLILAFSPAGRRDLTSSPFGGRGLR